MKDVYKIIDSLSIEGRGDVYVLKCFSSSQLKIGDMLFDLTGNRFKIKGFAMFRRSLGASFPEDQADVLFELVDGVKVDGHYLLRSPYDISFLFCNHPLEPHEVDEDYLAEFEAASQNHECALFSYEAMQDGKLSLFGSKIAGLTVYRGWMMWPELYEVFYEKLLKEGIVLINTPEEYRKYHLLPGWYDDLKNDTAFTVWEDKGTLESALTMTKGLTGSYIVKDYVKSRKHEWYDACYIQKIADKKNAATVIGNFIERQGADLVGGVVLRKYEKLRQMGYHEKSGMPLSEEYRAFVLAGQIRILDDYWSANQNTGLSAEEYDWVKRIAESVKSSFVTIDLARREDGQLIVIELGDGQVSGIQQITPYDFYQSFNPCVVHLDDDFLIEDIIASGAVIYSGDTLPDISCDELRQAVESSTSTQEIIDDFVIAHNKLWYIEDDAYDYEVGTLEYKRIRAIVETWGKLMDDLEARILQAAKAEGLWSEQLASQGILEQLKPIMEKYGYRDGQGWWVKAE